MIMNLLLDRLFPMTPLLMRSLLALALLTCAFLLMLRLSLAVTSMVAMSQFFPYALAFHTLMPLFPPAFCECGEFVDPLGLHYASCIKIDACNLLHNALRDCFYGSYHRIVRDLPAHNVALLVSDKVSKASTYIHHWYPLKSTAPDILQRQVPYNVRPLLSAPSKSPDILVALFDSPPKPLFGDFVFASPHTSDKTVHSEAAQAACNLKHADYSKHHTYPSDVFFPLAVIMTPA
jgi:hypothetical protein